MGEQTKEKKTTKHICMGLLAHVDAGKTTLSEALLYRSGQLKKLGRVDHKNAFLDTDALERERGITIFSKQALFTVDDLEITLLDTPGHADFSSEMERTLQILDYAVLVVNGVDGVQGHTQTLWQLLKQYEIPVFLFINKMDLAGAEHTSLMENLNEQLSDTCVDFSRRGGEWAERFWESVAMCDEEALTQYLDLGQVEDSRIARMIRRRQLFPCFFGSALKLDGVDSFLHALARYTLPLSYPPNDFAAKVFKISRDPLGNRLTHLKVTGGQLKVKDLVSNGGASAVDGKTLRNGGRSATFHSGNPTSNGKLVDPKGENPTSSGRSAAPNAATSEQLDEIPIWEEKVDQIRIYSGVKYQTADWVPAGTVCAVTGLNHTFPGQGLGQEPSSHPPILEPVVTYQVRLPEESDPYGALLKLKLLEEEDPQLHLVWNERLRVIHIQLMGEIQLEVLKRQILERLGLAISFGEGHIAYRETIAAPVEGIGHFEPLRHYAEVHLLLTPGKPGSGLEFSADCGEEMLGRIWQKLILSQLQERSHLGVLTGSPITDLKITLVAGRAHEEHTEGGDFRQAAYRAVRQGLLSAQSVLLEPWYQFRLELPSQYVGRAMSDLQRMCGQISQPESKRDHTVLTGSAPVVELQDYAIQLTAYTQGKGRLFCTLKGYFPCHNQEEAVAASGYDSQRDLDNPGDSVFCSHGAGYIVKWDQVREHMHVDSGLRLAPVPERRSTSSSPGSLSSGSSSPGSLSSGSSSRDSHQLDEELKAIFERTYGPIKQRDPLPRPVHHQEQQESGRRSVYSQQDSGLEYLLVDGYNVIFDWEELKEVAKDNLDMARTLLMDILCNYQGLRDCILILVFDAYKVPRGNETTVKYNNIHVVYTKEGQTADAYLERLTYEIAKKHRVRVVSSDSAVQFIILGHGALRLSANSFKAEVEQAEGQIAAILREKNRNVKIRPMEIALEQAMEQRSEQDAE